MTGGILTDEEIDKISFHSQIHEMGMCSCPCLPALLKVAEQMPTVLLAAKVEGVLKAFSMNDNQEEEVNP